MFFLDNFWLLTPPKTKRGGTPPPFHILNFKIFTKSKTWQFLVLKTRPERHFLIVFTMFYARAPFFTQKIATSKKIKKSLKNPISCRCLAFLGSRPLPQTDPSRGQFLTVFPMFYALECSMTSNTLQKRAAFLPRGGGRRHFARPLIAEAKATPHATRSNMPGIRCLVHRRI